MSDAILDLGAIIGWRTQADRLIVRIRAGDQMAPIEAQMLIDRATSSACRAVEQVQDQLNASEWVEASIAACRLVNLLANLFELAEVAGAAAIGTDAL